MERKGSGSMQRCFGFRLEGLRFQVSGLPPTGLVSLVTTADRGSNANVPWSQPRNPKS